MKRRLTWAIIGLMVVSLTSGVTLFLVNKNTSAVIAGEVFDARNGMPVYGAKISIGNKTTMIYLLKNFRLTGLPKGKMKLSVSAPMYYPFEKELIVTNNHQSIEIPLQGRAIEGLAGVLVWDKIEGNYLLLDVRLTNESGEVIKYFPSIPFKTDVQIYENDETTGAPQRGKILFAGHPEIIDEYSGELERLKCKIALNDIIKPRSLGPPVILDFTLRIKEDAFQFSRYDMRLGN